MTQIAFPLSAAHSVEVQQPQDIPSQLPKGVLSECCGCWISTLWLAESKEMIIVTNPAIQPALLACLIASFNTLHQSALLLFPEVPHHMHIAHSKKKLTGIKPNTVPSGGFHLIMNEKGKPFPITL